MDRLAGVPLHQLHILTEVIKMAKAKKKNPGYSHSLHQEKVLDTKLKKALAISLPASVLEKLKVVLADAQEGIHGFSAAK